jgi:prepilin peptidase CpaA
MAAATLPVWVIPAWLVLLVGLAAFTDLTRRRVYNWLTLPAMVIGVGLNAYLHAWAGVGQGVLGLAVGGLVFFPAFWWGGMGAGDIKLLAAIGAVLGWAGVLSAALYASLFGGIVAIAVLIARRRLTATLRYWSRSARAWFIPGPPLDPLPRSRPLAFAPIIAAGALAAYFLPPVFLLH